MSIDTCGCFKKLEVLFLGVLPMRALLFGVHVRAPPPDFWKFPCWVCPGAWAAEHHLLFVCAKPYLGPECSKVEEVASSEGSSKSRRLASIAEDHHPNLRLKRVGHVGSPLPELVRMAMAAARARPLQAYPTIPNAVHEGMQRIHPKADML